MIIVDIMMVLERWASSREVASYDRLEKRFRKLSTESRKSGRWSKPSDLAGPHTIGSAVIGRKTVTHPLYQNVYHQSGRLQTGVPGAVDELKKIVASMLKKYLKNWHRSYYVVGEFETPKRARFFKTLIARTSLPVRNLGYRNLRNRKR